MTVFEVNRSRLDAFRSGDRAVLTHARLPVVRRRRRDARQLSRGFSTGDPPVKVPGVADADRQREVVQESFVKAFAPSARLAYDGLSPFRP